MSKYAPYLCVTDDGYLWWPRQDAIRLAAGYQLHENNNHALKPELRATSNRVLANERTLIAALGNASFGITNLITFERDGICYIDAAGFLSWVSQYVCPTQAMIVFPDELFEEVIFALAIAPAQRPPNSCEPFENLTLALEAWFDQALDALPDAIRHRVQGQLSVPWNLLTSTQRRAAAMKWDHQNDPATKRDREFWLDLIARKLAFRQRIYECEAGVTPAVRDLAQKEDTLKDLRKEFATLKERQRQSSVDYYSYFAQTPPTVVDQAPTKKPGASILYIAYPKAIALLANRLDATPAELAAWVWKGPKRGGIAAYRKGDLLDPPQRFRYHLDNSADSDYLSLLMAAWFNEVDIAHFEPVDRYITGEALIERWSQQMGLQTDAFVRAKISESRLMDAHPIFDVTQGTYPERPAFPPLTSGLFLLAEVEEIEAEDFACIHEGSESACSSCQPVNAWRIKNHFAVRRDSSANDKWWIKMMRDAKRNGLTECRVGDVKTGPGGSMWQPHLVAAWLVDRQSKGREGLTPGAARAALKKFPDCEEIANELFPPDE